MPPVYIKDKSFDKELVNGYRTIEKVWLVHMGVGDRLVLKNIIEDEVRKFSRCPITRESETVFTKSVAYGVDRYLTMFKDSVPRKRLEDIGSSLPKRADLRINS